MENILKQIDKIHAEAVKRAEEDELFNPHNRMDYRKNQKHIANICQLRNMIKRVVDKFPNVTNDEQGEYYLDQLRDEYGSTASEQTDDLGFQEFEKENN